MMSETERRKMMEQRQERKMASVSTVPPIPSAPSTASNLLSVGPAIAAVSAAACDNTGVGGRSSSSSSVALDEYKLPPEMLEEIKLLEEYYTQSCRINPYTTSLPVSSSTLAANKSLGVLNTWMQFCKKIGHYFSLFPDFSSLSDIDQSVLLKTAMTSAGIIMGSVTFDSWMGKKASGTGPPMPKISFENIERLVPGDLLYRVKTFFRKFRIICPDETMAKILMLVSLYSPDLTGLQDDRRVQELQEHYTNILECYIKYKYQSKGGHMFANALVSLADVRELAERSLEMEINRSVMSEISGAQSDPSSDPGRDAGGGGGSVGGAGPGGGEKSGGGNSGGGNNTHAIDGGVGRLSTSPLVL